MIAWLKLVPGRTIAEVIALLLIIALGWYVVHCYDEAMTENGQLKVQITEANGRVTTAENQRDAGVRELSARTAETQGYRDANATLSTHLADALKLAGRVRLPAASPVAAKASPGPAALGGIDGAPQGGLSAANAEHLVTVLTALYTGSVQLASEADGNVNQIHVAQDELKRTYAALSACYQGK